MIIEHTQATRTIDEYDFIMQGGFPLSITIDKDQGDTIDYNEGIAVIIHIATKKSQINPDQMLPAEEFTIYANQILYVMHRTRTIAVATPDQQAAIKQLSNPAHPTIQ